MSVDEKSIFLDSLTTPYLIFFQSCPFFLPYFLILDRDMKKKSVFECHTLMSNIEWTLLKNVCCNLQQYSVLSIVKPGWKDMFFIVIFGGTVEITFLAHIIDVDVSDLGFS